jgi:hypothetical protein
MDEGVQDTQPLEEHLKDARCKPLSAEDQADIICILQPASPAAYNIVESVNRATPHHVAQRDDQDTEDDLQDELPRDKVTSGHSMEIALRISSKLRDPCMGFVFGRDPLRCDVVLEHPTECKRFSNMHFRIFVNESGIVMLEDMSTNGTVVDGNLLLCKNISPNSRKMQMLQRGSEISIILTVSECVKFHVTMPNRDRASEEYARNLGRYLKDIQSANLRHAAAPTGHGRNPPPLHVVSTELYPSRTYSNPRLIVSTKPRDCSSRADHAGAT